jgi:hypothetical protein
MCCGQKRSELRNSQVQSTARSPSQLAPGNSRAQVVRTQPSTPLAMRAVSPRESTSPPIRSVWPQAPTPTSVPQSSISVRYLENSPIRVRGCVSGISYEFSGSHAVQLVDARDASSLLNTRFFRRA